MATVGRNGFCRRRRSMRSGSGCCVVVSGDVTWAKLSAGEAEATLTVDVAARGFVQRCFPLPVSAKGDELLVAAA